MRPGELIAERFELERLAGSGGMGAVFRARDRHTGAAVAVKLLRGKGERRAARFAREARALAELTHPGIVRYLAHGVTPAGLHYLAMEWLDGADLARRIAVGPLAVGDSVLVMRQIAQALAAAHARGLV